jgi:four helix bundle protein
MIESYKNLIVWQKAMDLVEEIYRATGQFPKEETYGLSIQMRRAGVSIPSNIAEGSRRKNLPEYLQFLRIAAASAAELETQLLISKRIYNHVECLKSEGLLNEIQKMLYVLLKKLSSKNLKPETLHLKPNAGFTLVELVVAIGVFSLLISIAIGGFIQALRSERQTVALLSANSNASLILEQMAREIRTARTFSTTPGELDFTNAKGEAVAYCLNSATASIERVVSNTCGSGQRLTSRTVAVRTLDFIASGIAPGDLYPPRITIRISLSSTGEAAVQNAVINLQTTVSARNL